MKKLALTISIFSMMFLASLFFTGDALAAANNFISGGVDNNWGTAGNWSLGAVPTASDGNITTFTSSSPNCTVNGNRVANEIDFSSYTNTITMTGSITVSGNITLGASMNVSGTGNLADNATGNFTSNGFSWPNGVVVNGNSKIVTFTDASNLGYLQIAAANGTNAVSIQADMTLVHLFYGITVTPQGLNGLFNVYISGSITGAGTTSYLSGTANLILNGTGTWSGVNTGGIRNNLIINTSGTITVSGNVYYNSGTLTYTAGTVVTTSSTLNVIGTATLNTNGIAWNNVSFSGTAQTFTFSSDLTVQNLTCNAYTSVLLGDKTIYINGNYTQALQFGNPGNTTIVMRGTGTLLATGFITPNLVINTAGTITFGATIYFGVFSKTITYTAGTVITTNSLLSISAGRLDIDGIILDDFQVYTGNVTLVSDLIISGHFSSLDFASVRTINSSSVGTQRKLTLLQGGTQSVSLIDATDIDSGDGLTIWSNRGNFSNSINWKNITSLPTISNPF